MNGLVNLPNRKKYIKFKQQKVFIFNRNKQKTTMKTSISSEALKKIKKNKW